MKRRLLIGLLICFIVTVAVWEYAIRSPIIQQKDLHYILLPGTTAHQLADYLHKNACLIHPIFFRAVVRLRGADHALQAGEYVFPKGSSINDVLNQLVSGSVYYRPFTIVNGWTFHRVMQALNQAPKIKHVLSELSDQQIAKKLGIKQLSPEGWLYPDTYHYVKNTTDLKILQWAHENMEKRFQTSWKNRAKGLWYKNPYQALIVASMIEKETSIKSEKPLIAAIILARLKKWMHLQIDSTVIYGLNSHFKGDLTRRDLKLKTPYNTYVNYGLPPTPISMLNQSSIDAALHPVKTEMLYFVSKNDGTHLFCKTLACQNEAVKKYQLRKP